MKIFALAVLSLVGMSCAQTEPSQGADGRALETSTSAEALLRGVRARFVQHASIAPAMPGVAGVAGLPVMPGADALKDTPLLPVSLVTSVATLGGRLVATLPASTSAKLTHVTATQLGLHARDAFVLESEGARITATLQGATNAQAQLADGYVVYAGGLVSGNVRADVMHRVTTEGTEDYVHYAQAPAKPELSYALTLEAGVAGLRLVGNTLEMLDAGGTPKLRVSPPYGVDANGARFEAKLSVGGCAVDTDPRGPWARTVTAPGATACEVHVSWASDVAYPAVVDPAWVNTLNLPMPLGAAGIAELPGNKVLVVGGTTSGGVSVTDAFLYDIATNVWAATGNAVNSIGWSQGIAVAGGKFLFSEGAASVQTYDPISGVFSALALQPSTGNRHSIALSDGRVMFAGASNPWEVYDVVAGTYQSTVAPNEALANGYVSWMLPSGDVLAGTSSTPVGQQWSRWNHTANTWSLVASPGRYDIREFGFGRSRTDLVIHTSASNLWPGADGRFLAFNEVNNTWTLGAPLGGWTTFTFATESGLIYSADEGGYYFRVWDPVARADVGAGVNVANGHGFCYATRTRLSDGRLMVAGGNGCNATHTAEARIAGCSSDTDCSGRPFGYVEQSVCDTSPGPFTGLCRMPNAKPLLAKALGGAVCTATSGQRQCAAGVCSTLDNACGLTNGEVAVDSVGAPTTDSKVCRSNVINADGRCGQPNSDPLAGPPVQNACTDPNPAPVVSGACRSGVCFSQAGASNAADNECGEPNGEPCASNAVCRTVCTAADGTCGLLNGASCTQAAACRSGVCNADGKCGNPNGDRCQFATTCRSGICKAGVCSPTCATDANCGGAFWCETTTAQCVADGPTGAKPKGSAGAPVSCDRAAQCLSGACGTMDGLCGLPDGTACPVDVRQCRAGLCTAGACGKGCAVDADCGAGAYCEDSNPAAKSCVRSEPNGAQTGPAAGPKTTACTTARGAAQCASGLCNADGQCGDPDGAACASASTCRSGGCQGGVCGAGCAPKGASGDAQCAPSFYCTNPAAPATSGTCTTDAGNGAKPSDGAGGTTACDRPGQCASNVCNADGLCGQPDGAACASAGQCRTNVCLAGLCGAATGCLADANCKVTDYCKTPGPGTGACTPKTANDTACTAGNTCLTSVCNADGKCGQPKGQSCGANVLCRSQLCDLTQLKCVGCTQDAQCSAGQSCEATVSECKDKDTDGDGILDKNEWGTGGAASPQDTDGDGTPDWKDTDDDGDGLLTKDELGPGGATSPRDTDGDGKPDYVDADDDNDGILTSREIADGKLPGVSSDDVDADGKKNWLDTDSDGDGLLDANEKGDANTNGIPDYLEVAKPVAPVVPNADAGAPVLPVLPGTPDAGAPAKAQDNGSVAGGGLNCAAAFGVLPDASTAALGILMLAFCTRRKAKNRAA